MYLPGVGLLCFWTFTITEHCNHSFHVGTASGLCSALLLINGEPAECSLDLANIIENTGQCTHEVGLDASRHLVPAIVLKAITNGTVQLHVGIIQVVVGITYLTRLFLRLFQIGVQLFNGFTKVSASGHTLTTEYLLHHLTGHFRIRVYGLQTTSHLLQCIEHGQRAVAQLLRHLIAVDSHLLQGIARGLRHQSDILDTHHDGVHVLVGENTTLRVLYDGHQLTRTDTSVAECWCILLNHLEQFSTVTLQHAAHAVAQYHHSILARLTELRHQRVSGLDGLSEVHVVGIDHCPCLVRHLVGVLTFQTRDDCRLLVLLRQFSIITSPCLRRFRYYGNTGTNGTSHQSRL